MHNIKTFYGIILWHHRVDKVAKQKKKKKLQAANFYLIL